MMTRRRERKGNTVQEINMTAMCDVVFQLLIYLILTAKPILVTTALEVNRPRADEVPPPGPPIPMVEIMVFQDSYAICGKQVKYDVLDKSIQKLAKIDNNQMVIIKCAPDSAHAKLVGILDLCSRTDMRNISVMSM